MLSAFYLDFAKDVELQSLERRQMQTVAFMFTAFYLTIASITAKRSGHLEFEAEDFVQLLPEAERFNQEEILDTWSAS